MRGLMKDTAGIVLVVAIGAAALAGLGWGGWAMYDWLGPKYESTRRDIMIESRYYSEATVRELYRMRREWEKTPADQRGTIEAAARHEFSAFDAERLPPDLRAWMNQIR